ncbi:uncharacterized protein DSM5745_01316 [Aspergillus mulundensis]|uniref:Fungal-type protein kinase domain-containing protein n=1 Tax=Aspergillus mulundensis TaxID=1810919 RepID=A0A3D8T641_9EURO|nr:hypothetical protein DSM5745_01316 [Aspergillus mulundensis]RDW93994.1 hypothetical protein DSM5745_01316 [Aspergillus mulundensis]
MAGTVEAGSPFHRNLGLYSCLTAIKPTSDEGPVNIFWTTICAEYFPPSAGYKTAVMQRVLQDDTMPDFAVFKIVLRAGPRRNTNDLHEKQIFIVECKRPSKDTPAEWTSATDQLIHYCENNVDGSTRILAATAIGRKVKFWRYDAGTLSPLSAVLDLSWAAGQNETVQMLDYVRTHGWAWNQSGSA